jgi:hypothetical protein
MSNNSEEFLEEFHKHTISDSNQSYLLLTDQALYMLSGVFENWPFLEGAIDKTNKYRINIRKYDFELFFLPAIKRLYEN